MPDAELRDFRDLQYARVESDLLCDPRIPYGHKALYALLITYGPSRIFPGQETLAKCLDVKRETINRWLKAMKACKLITWQRRRNKPNLYAILGYKRSLFAIQDVTEESHPGNVGDAALTLKSDSRITRSRSNELDPVWDIVLAELEWVISKSTFRTYYQHTALLSLNNTHAEVQCGDVEWFDTQGRAMVERQLSAVAGRDVSVVFV